MAEEIVKEVLQGLQKLRVRREKDGGQEVARVRVWLSQVPSAGECGAAGPGWRHRGRQKRGEASGSCVFAVDGGEASLTRALSGTHRK